MKYCWKDKKGNIHSIESMKASHIQNCIRLIQKKENWRTEYLSTLKAELRKRKLKRIFKTI